jgi:auxin efflux carrier family protein
LFIYLAHNLHMLLQLQAALPLAVASFVYAEEYKVHADIMSTGFVPLPLDVNKPRNNSLLNFVIVTDRTRFLLSISCRVILGIFISLPVTIVYYILLGL